MMVLFLKQFLCGQNVATALKILTYGKMVLNVPCHSDRHRRLSDTGSRLENKKFLSRLKRI